MNVWKSENEPYYIIFERNKRVKRARKKAAVIVILNLNFHFSEYSTYAFEAKHEK